jgi:hypothetical protein
MPGLNQPWDEDAGGSGEGCDPKHLFLRSDAHEEKVF